MKYILYCALKKDILVREMIYSIKSLFHVCKNLDDITIIILTDQNIDKTIFDRFSCIISEKILFDYIDDSIVKKWATNYIFTIKIKAIEYILTKYKSDLIFIDSDTMIMKDIVPLYNHIKNGHFLLLFAYQMNFKELSDKGMYPKMFSQLEIRQDRLFFPKDKIELSLSYHHYNTGVIGISYDNRDIFSEVLDLSNIVYNRFGQMAAEEFAFACVFQKYGVITTCDRNVYHYLYAKWTRLFIADFFNQFYLDDYNELSNFLLKYEIDGELLPKVNYDDLPSFFHFIDKYFLKINSIDRDYLYLGGDNSFAAEILNDTEKYLKYIYLYERKKRLKQRLSS